MRIPSGYLYYDTPIGILCLDTLFPKPPGQLRNPLTFDFPVVCRVLRGVGAKEILSSTSAQLETLFVDAARELERDGVRAIAGSCGFMALFQKAVASAVSVPVLMSSLVQIPLIHTLHGPGCRIGVLTAHSGSLTPEHFRQAGVPDAQIDALAIAGMENFPVFRKTILEGAAPVMDTDAVGAEIGAAAAAMTDGQPLDALLLECTDLSVFARTVQEGVSVPVYDINSLIAYAAFCVRRNQWV
ncbi:aspartate/glutamate racemase family protein [Bilophila wadsworthia]|uniref:aspartate/glutamate racemase family protein n=1 Tax=Bilophila wadsworthia TaxID=35833 RepID=UPI00243243A3|nr:aspartate/glutamate racemase family protein [Bilophila wadsworthia]